MMFDWIFVKEHFFSIIFITLLPNKGSKRFSEKNFDPLIVIVVLPREGLDKKKAV